MKKHFRLASAKKSAVKGTGSSKSHKSSKSQIVIARTKYIAAMQELAETNREEVRSLAAITERLKPKSMLFKSQATPLIKTIDLSSKKLKLVESSAAISDEEEQKLRAQERVDKIRKLRNLSYNFNNSDSERDFNQVPAYLRRETDLYNGIANVENFYNRARVKKEDDTKASISTINTFLDGNNPD